MSYLLAFVLAGLATAEVSYNTPFQVVMPSSNHSSMQAVPNGLAYLMQHEGNIALVSVVGPYHSGKSFLLNALLQHTQAFAVGRHTSPETMGIWLCRTNLTARDGSEVWLMDSEGFFGPGVDESYDAKVFTVATLVGAHVVYNTVKVIDQQAVGLLEMLVHRAQLFRTRSAATKEDAPDFLQSQGFPPLTWVVEDFVQELPERMKSEGATGWLRTYLESSSSVDGDTSGLSKAGRKSDFLTKVYRDIRVHTLFLPATTRSQLQDLSKLSWNQLTDEFRTEVTDLRQHIMRTLQARTSGGKPMNGRSMAQALQFIVRGLDKGMFHELPSLWGTWASQVAGVSLNDASSWFVALTQRIDPSSEEPVPVAVFNERLEQARETATQFYRSLLRDFEVQPQVGELRRRMDVHLQEHLLPLYHERVRRWVAEGMAVAKAQFDTFLSGRTLPADPEPMERGGKEVAEVLCGNFSVKLSTFSNGPLAASSTLLAIAGKSPLVAMPEFVPEPAAQLAADLRARLGARSLENERAVQALFAAAALAAEQAVNQELKSALPAATTTQPGGRGQEESRSQLLSKERLVLLRNSAEKLCWQAFNDALALHAWSKASAHYKTTRALVLTELLEKKFKAFASANDQRLKAYFSVGLNKAIAAYSSNRTLIAMPILEADLESEQNRLSIWAKELLAGSAGFNTSAGRSFGLSDTDAFAEAKGKLDVALKEGFQQLREKNVELWKAHSDEATRCGATANRASEKSGGYVCLFNTLPWAHRSISRRHLSDCMQKSAIGARMGLQLQSKVFEAWYSKDLGHEVNRVNTRFTVVMIATTFFVAAAAWFCLVRGTSPVSHNYYGQVPCQQAYQQPIYGSYFAQGQPTSMGQAQMMPQANFYGQCQTRGVAAMQDTTVRSRFGFIRSGA